VVVDNSISTNPNIIDPLTVTGSYGLPPGGQAPPGPYQAEVNNNIGNGIWNDGSIPGYPVVSQVQVSTIDPPGAQQAAALITQTNISPTALTLLASSVLPAGTANVSSPDAVQQIQMALTAAQADATSALSAGSSEASTVLSSILGGIAGSAQGVETAINASANSLSQALGLSSNPALTATAQAPILTNALTATGTTGLLNSLVTWVKANPVEAAAAGLAIAASGAYVVNTLTGHKVTTAAVAKAAGIKTTKHHKKSHKHKIHHERRGVHHHKLKFGSRAYREKYLGHK
jgi:hypothetical protein